MAVQMMKALLTGRVGMRSRLGTGQAATMVPCTTKAGIKKKTEIL